MISNGQGVVDPNNIPLASLVAHDDNNVDVNFIKNNNFNNNAYRSVSSDIEVMLKDFISTQTTFNKIHINIIIIMSNQRSKRNIIWIYNTMSIRNHVYNGINFITQRGNFLNRIYLLTSWSSFSVPFRVTTIISSRSFVAAPRMMDIKVPAAAESNKFLEEKFSPA